MFTLSFQYKLKVKLFLKQLVQSLYFEMENDGNSNGPNRTALDIPEIVSIVASNIREVEDMKNVRTLNRAWRKETLKNWRNSAVFVLNKETMRVLTRAFDESAFMGLAKKAKEKVEAEIDPFLLRKLPFRNYRVSKDVDIWYECADNELIFQEVLAPYANYLDVGECALAPNNHVLQYVDDLDFNFKLNITELAITPLRNKVLLQGKLDVVAGRRWKPFKASKLRHLTISAPTARRQQELALDAKELGPLFKLDNTIDLEDTAKFFIAMRMPILEILHVKSGGGISHILRALTGAAQDNFKFIKLKELTVASSPENTFYGDDAANYLDVVRPPVRVLKIPIWWGECIRGARFIRSLRLIQSTLTQLELHLIADLQFDILVSGFSDLYLNGCTFRELVTFKVVVEYKRVHKHTELISFNLNHLRKMPKLSDFYFGIKDIDNPTTVKGIGLEKLRKKVDITQRHPCWFHDNKEFIIEDGLFPLGMNFDPILEDEVEGEGLANLRSFHFQGNLMKSAMKRLAKWTKNLERLETVLDRENFPVVAYSAQNGWSRLSSMRVLTGSPVPKMDFSVYLNSNVV